MGVLLLLLTAEPIKAVEVGGKEMSKSQIAQLLNPEGIDKDNRQSKIVFLKNILL